MDAPGHGTGAWQGAQSPTTCTRCGSSVPPAVVHCPRCGYGNDDALTIAPGFDTPAPPAAPLTADDDALTRFGDADDALTVARAPLDDVPADAVTMVTEPGSHSSGEAMTSAGTADDAMTLAASQESLADAMTVATPVASTAGTPGTPRRTRRSADGGPLEIGQSFGPRYHVIRLLGAGGMGAVYQAWDAELGVAVAIKVIRPEVMADPATAEEVSRRFKRELLLARQVTHKNVVRIHDLGDIDGIKYITMSYVEGTDLSTILRRDGRQSVADVLRIARAVISGLVAAHAAGVVHRDLKPANIMIGADGQALIMDFGIAHSTGDPAAPAAGAGLVPENLRRAASHHAATTVGSIVGTLEYMAPEQARGQAIDQRADVYAFGLILYDILLGRRRVSSGQAAVEELQRRMAAPPPPLQALEKDIPAPLAALVARCVEPEAEKRFQTSADVLAEFDRLDDAGQLIPIRKTIGLPLMAAVVALLTVVFGGAWWYFREPPVVTHDPVSVLIADLENQTGDAAFDHTLEPMLKRALEGAEFISAYDRSSVRDLGVRPPDALNPAAAQELATKQGVRVVLAGSIAPRGNGYEISVTLKRTVGDDVVVTAQERAGNRDEVVSAATKLMLRVREALGDEDADTGQQYAAGGLSTTSLDVVRLYSAAVHATADSNFDEAHQSITKAVAADPNFGIGYLILAVLARNNGNLAGQQKYLDQALAHLGDMTERERYTTRAYAALAGGDYAECVKQLNEQITKYPGVITGRNQLALCLSYLREMRRAVQEMQKVVGLMPGQSVYRDNLALYSNYASDFATGGREAETVLRATTARPDRYAGLALAFSKLGQGQLSEARVSYERLAKMSRGASFAASGLADLAILEGHFTDAVPILRKGAEQDLADGNPDLAASKFAAMAYAELSRRQLKAAILAAEEALKHSTAPKIRLLAGRTFIEAGEAKRATPLIDGLAKELYDEPQAYAKILRGLVALYEMKDPRAAMVLLRDANTQFKTWLGLFYLGRASFEAGAFPAADSAFDECLNARRGEALALFADEEPTYAHVVPAYYWLGRTREQLGNKRFVEQYHEYQRLRSTSTEDPLLAEVRQRAARATGGA